mgnify:CR=1 FL=1
MSNTVDTQMIQSLDSAHFLHPFTDFKDLGTRGARVITKAQGVYVWDSEGKSMLDAMSGLWCVNVGYGRKELAEAAYQQMMTLPYYNSFFQTTNVPATKLAAKLASLAPSVGDRSFNHVFYSSSGSESNDTNVRMVRRYWDLMGQPQRKTIIGRVNGYHGRLKNWMRRFKGVASSYLASYLGWFRALDRSIQTPRQPAPFLALAVGA